MELSTEITFADNFKKFRKIRGISQKEFAQKLYEYTGKMLTLTSISNYETGIHMPSPQVLPYIARILEVSLDALFGTQSAENAVSDDRKEGKDIIQSWKQEIDIIEKKFYMAKMTQFENLSIEARSAMECFEEIIKISKKQQDELLIIQTELSTIREMFSFLRH